MAKQHTLKLLRQLSSSPAAPKLTPTSRMAVVVLDQSRRSLSIGDLCDLTGAVPSTLLITMRMLLRAGVVTVKRVRGQQYYSLAPSPVAQATIAITTESAAGGC
jgi:DNA-binding transcriptional ArsR family regulator